MHRTITNTIFIFLVMLNYHCLFGQDPSYSQFYANRMYLNPAFTGIEAGITAAGIYRNQWHKVDKGFRTYGVSAELKEPYIRSGFGFQVYQDVAGIANLKTTSFGFSYAYTILLKKSNLHIGGLWNINSKRLDWNQLLFSDQLDPVFGNTLSTSAIPGMEKTTYWDMNMGVVWRKDGKIKIGGETKKARSNIGISINHLPSLITGEGANQSLLNQAAFLPPRLTIHAGTMIPTTIFVGPNGKSLIFSPNIKMDIQGPKLNWKNSLRTLTYGAFIGYEGYFLGGYCQSRSGLPQLSNTNAWIMTFGGFVRPGRRTKDQHQKYYIGLSVDLNGTGIGTQGGNVYELAFRLNFSDVPSIFGRKKGTSAKQVLDCKDFY